MLELAENIKVIATANNGKHVDDFLIRYKPDILLLDLQMPEVDGFAVLKHLQSSEVKTKVIVLTTFNDVNYMNKCKALGAMAFLLKDVSLEELVAIIEKIQGGKYHFPENETKDNEQLTPREHEIMNLIADGNANKEIARMLDISEGTVKNHISNILSKYNVRDRTQAVIKFRKVSI